MTGEGGYIMGVVRHAQERLAQHYGAQFSAEQWHDVVLQIIDRRAQLVMGMSPAHPDSEIWLCATPIGEIRVVWLPGMARIVTVLGPSGTHSITKFPRNRLGIQRLPAARGAIGSRRALRERANWRRQEWDE